jgi:hypothetical protein
MFEKVLRAMHGTAARAYYKLWFRAFTAEPWVKHEDVRWPELGPHLARVVDSDGARCDLRDGM